MWASRYHTRTVNLQISLHNESKYIKVFLRLTIKFLGCTRNLYSPFGGVSLPLQHSSCEPSKHRDVWVEFAEGVKSRSGEFCSKNTWRTLCRRLRIKSCPIFHSMLVISLLNQVSYNIRTNGIRVTNIAPSPLKRRFTGQVAQRDSKIKATKVGRKNVKH